MKKIGFYIRVSTERQVKVVEGSLKNQDQLLTHHVEFKSKLSNEQWVIVDRYVDEGKSAKDTKGRPEYQRMIQDIEKGKIDTVLCVSLSRISRSTRDLLDMVEYFKEMNVDFICLKEDFDTTTAQGKCFLTIMGALNEFEREQTSERTRSNMLARAERGLWNGGQLLGYNLNIEKKGYIIPNDEEKIIVNFCFDAYLECGSILKTCDVANSKGYHTKEYSTKGGNFHTSKKFGYTPMLKLLTNLAYIGKREINKYRMHKSQENLPEDQRYRVVKAVWEPIVDEDKFYNVQKLLKENCQHKYNGAKPTKHFYLLNGGVLGCRKCGSAMEGRSCYGNDRKKMYYYYSCTNRDCRFKLPELEIENALRDSMRTIAKDDSVVEKIVLKTNVRLKNELPRLINKKQGLAKELKLLNGKASHIMDKFVGVTNGEEFVKEELSKLSLRKQQIVNDIDMTDIAISTIEKESVDRDFINRILGSFDEIYRDDIKPYQKKELLYGSLAKIELSNTQIKVGMPLEQVSPISLREAALTSNSTSLRGAFFGRRNSLKFSEFRRPFC